MQQRQSIKILQEEEKYMTQAENLVKISAEIAAFQRDAIYTRGLSQAEADER